MDSKVRYDFYVNAMPVTGLELMNELSKNNIVNKAKNSKRLRKNARLNIDYELETLN